MMRNWLIPLAAMLPFASLAADKEVVRLQRDVALLSDDVRVMQRAMDERTGAMMALLQQTLERVNQVHTANAVMERSLTERLRQQEKSAGVPIATFGTKIDQLAADALAVREAVADMNARLKRLEQKLVDVENAVRIIHAPPPSPSGETGGPPAGVTAHGLFQAAVRDQLAGNYDLALREFRDYLRYLGDTELAVASQFHIGEIALNQGEPEAALEAFNRVLEEYPKSAKAPDALYLRARVLEKQGKRSEALRELNRLARAYPSSDAAKRVPSELKRLRATARASSRK